MSVKEEMEALGRLQDLCLKLRSEQLDIAAKELFTPEENKLLKARILALERTVTEML